MAYLELLTTGDGPISVDTAKSHARISNDLEDVLIQIYLDSIFEFVEDFTGKDIRVKTYQQTGDQLGNGYYLCLMANQVLSVESIFYSLDGVETEITSDEYYLYREIYESKITPIPVDCIPQEFPVTDGGPNGYTVNFTTSYPSLPSSLIGAMLNHFLFFYENRGDAIAAGASAGSGLITAPPESLRIYKQFRTTRI